MEATSISEPDAGTLDLRMAELRVAAKRDLYQALIVGFVILTATIATVIPYYAVEGGEPLISGDALVGVFGTSLGYIFGKVTAIRNGNASA